MYQERRLSFGNARSRAPIIIGTRKFPKTAGIDGIKKKIDPAKAGFGPLDTNIYDLDPEAAKNIRSVPGSLRESLTALKNDHAYLTEGSVFTEDLIETWLDYKRTAELDELRLRPHPHEFELYYDV